jgi:drug/metabolite transporter (DMT)-like permease
MVMLSAVCFSAKAIFAKLAYRHGADASTMLSLRMAFSLPFFAVAGWIGGQRPGARRFTRSEQLRLLLLGSAGYYLASWLDFQGLTLVSAGLERLILFVYPTLVVMLNVALGLERVTARIGAALSLCYGGVLLVVWSDHLAGGSDVALGSTLIFLSAVAYTGYLVGSQPLSLRHGSVRVTAWIMVAMSLCAFAQFALENRWQRLSLPWPVYLLGMLTGVVATVVPAFLLAAGMKRLGTSRASLIATVGPVATLLLAYWLLDEPITAIQIVGSALVLLGVWMVSQRRGTAAAEGSGAARK